MFPRVSFIVLFLSLSVYPIESSAFSWTKNFRRNNLSRFQVASITAPKLHEMRQRQGADVLRIGASSSSSVSSLSSASTGTTIGLASGFSFREVQTFPNLLLKPSAFSWSVVSIRPEGPCSQRNLHALQGSFRS